MIIIFEGADGVGKTTAVQHVVDAIRLTEGIEPRVLHRGPPKRDPLLEYTCDLEYAGHTNRLDWVVCDRWHWGEMIYGPLYRESGSLLSGAGHRAIDEFLARRGALMIHLDAQTDTVLERLAARGDDYVDIEDVPHIIDAYRTLAELETPMHVRTMYDFDAHTAQLVVRDVKMIAYMLERESCNDLSHI